MSTLSPSCHILIRFRELLEEALHVEGHSPQVISQTSALAFELWHNSTLAELFECAREVLPGQEYTTLVRFCRQHYPLTATAIRLDTHFTVQDLPAAK